jgi:hypothetical protein
MSWAELLKVAEAIRAAAASLDGRAARLPIAGVGWTTVDHERAEEELDGLLGAAGPWVALERDAALGARGWWRAAVREGQPPFLVVLEPDTEGRLAASLARFGEGVAVVYLGSGGPPAGPPSGPGPGTLVRGGPAWGPHAVILRPGIAVPKASGDR